MANSTVRVNKGYGELIKRYVAFLRTKLQFHKDHPEFSGNMSYEDYLSLRKSSNIQEGYCPGEARWAPRVRARPSVSSDTGSATVVPWPLDTPPPHSYETVDTLLRLQDHVLDMGSKGTLTHARPARARALRRLTPITPHMSWCTSHGESAQPCDERVPHRVHGPARGGGLRHLPVHGQHAARHACTYVHVWPRRGTQAPRKR